MKPWYRAQLSEIEAFFDVNPAVGLTGAEALKRINKFGKNISPLLPVALGRIYRATVLRQGKLESVSLQHVALGDVVVLKAGDRVPADLRLVKVDDLQIDESKMTGNDLAVKKNTYAVAKEVPLAEQKCMAFGGTFVASGHGVGVVVAAGKNQTFRVPYKNNMPKGVQAKLLARRLHKQGVIIGNWPNLKQLDSINTVFFDADLTDKEIAETIRKVQLIKKTPCKFLVSEAQAVRLQNELRGVKAVALQRLAGQITRQMVGTLDEAQFIIGSDPALVLRTVRVLADNDIRIMWVTDGRTPQPAMLIAAATVIIGGLARDDVTCKANLIAPQGTAQIVASIIHNNK